jgi:hypothetical protein
MRTIYVSNARARILVGALLLMAASAVQASADSVTLSGVQASSLEPSGDVVFVDLLAFPGAVLHGQEVGFGTESRAVVSFFASVTGSLGEGADTLRATFSLPSGSPPPFSNLVQQASLFSVPGTYVFGLDFPLLYHPVPSSLTLDLLQSASPGTPLSSTTVTFSVVQPVPEPSGLALSGVGLAVLMFTWRRRSRQPTLRVRLR